MNPAPRLAVFALFLGPAFASGAAAHAPLAGQERARIVLKETIDPEKRLTQIREDIEALKKKIAAEDKKEKTMLSSLDRIGFAKSLIRKEQAALAIDLEKNGRELSAIGRDIPALEANLGREKEDLAKVLVALFKYGRFPTARFLMMAADLRTFVSQSKNLELLASFQDRMISSYGRDLAELGRAEETLKTKEQETRTLLARAGAKRAELEAEEKKNQALMDQIRTNKRDYSQTLEELAFRAQELQKLLQDFEKQTPALDFPVIPITEGKGRLTWPAGGRILQPYGIQHGPFNTVTMNNGVEIAPREGDPAVRAVHSGKIVYADYFQGYGNLIILDHGQTYYSLYGHLAEFLVQKGDYVKGGQTIGLAGDTGSMVGVSVYFEIRYKTKPVDPLQWLSRR
jgi:septal ring factor EnvC (AmiA/AmiB activator)